MVGGDADCRLFQRFMNLGHYSGDHSTRQGIYMVTPNGKLLASCNTHSTDRIAKEMAAALDRWKVMAAERKRLDADTRAALTDIWRWEDEYPEQGLVLELNVRDLRPPDRSEGESRRRRRWRWTERAWNRDWIWFRKEEARQWLPQPLEAGVRREVPRALVERLARLHLLDSVRGQPRVFAAEELKDLELHSAVAAVDGGLVHLEFEGHSLAEVAEGEEARGMDLQLSGRATWDPEQESFTAFELLADGERWGGSQFNFRRRDPQRTPIGFVLRLAAEGAPRVAPAFVWRYGWRPGRR